MQAAEEVNVSAYAAPATYLRKDRVQYLANLPARSDSLGLSVGAYRDGPAHAYELVGQWVINGEYAELESGAGAIRIVCTANRVHLVVGSDHHVRAEVYVDSVLDNHVAIGAHGLYMLADIVGTGSRHVLEIRFLDSGISAFAFTFG